MKLIVGLGNPGLKYKNTRHNIGFSAIERISEKFHIPVRKRKYNGRLGRGSIEGEKVTLFTPHTYMNLSGEAVRQAVKNEKITFNNFLAISDDINLQFGFIRLRKKGSSGGHNGMGSIIGCLGTGNFPRLRVGIGKGRSMGDVTRFVLKPFNSVERPQLTGIIEEVAECAASWVKDGPDKAMTKFNKKQSPRT